MKVATLTILSTVFLFGIVSVYCERSDHHCGPKYGNPGCSQGRCCSIHGWCGGSAGYCQGGNCDYQCWARSLLLNNIDNNNAVSEIISESLFDEMFKHRKDCPSQGFYSYDALITAAASFSDFCNTGDVATRKRELAAFLAQTSQATTGRESDSLDPYAWGYCHINTTTSGVENDYCTSSNWACASGKKYYSRGPIQLTHNHNYGFVGEALGIDLIKTPDLVATDAVVSFKTAIWFWMIQHNNKPSCHDIIVNANSETSQVLGHIIHGNSGQKSSDLITNSIGYYKRYCDMLEVSYGDNMKYWYDETHFSDVSHLQMPVY
ncbi:mulatexin-like [Morus notabilis]|uniref:mulatexin-like n=1 Tax=Morus notabilis TaxID=981085 RepID=UPI000CED3C3A|nr:mulatexin-like [Morus notabilis]